MTVDAVFPLSTAYLPGDKVVLRVFEERYLAMMDDIMASGATFVSVLIARGSEVGGNDARFAHGVRIRVDGVLPESGSLMVVGTAMQCCSIVSWSDECPYPTATTESMHERPLTPGERHDAASSLSLLAQRTRRLLALVAPEDEPRSEVEFVTVAAGRWWSEGVDESLIWRAFWAVARHLPCGPLDRYQLLCPGDLMTRMTVLRRALDHASEVAEFRQRTQDGRGLP